MEKVKELIENKRILALVGILGNVLGIILPFYTITFFGYTSSAAAIDSWVGIVLLIFGILSGVVIFSDLIKSKFPEVLNNSFGKFIEKVNDPKFGFVPAVIIALFIIYLIPEYTKELRIFWLASMYTIRIGSTKTTFPAMIMCHICKVSEDLRAAIPTGSVRSVSLEVMINGQK